MAIEPIEHFEKNQIKVGGKADDGSEMLLKIETSFGVRVIWRCKKIKGDPDFVLDIEELIRGKWRYRRMEKHLEGFKTYAESLDGLSKILAEQLE
jgi:hypothetical protein